MEFKFQNKKFLKMVKEKGLKLTKVAEKIDMSRSGIGDIASGKNDPRFKTVTLISKILDINPIEFFVSGEIAKDILPKHMDEEMMEFILDGKNIDYIKVAMEIKEKNISPSIMRIYMNAEFERRKL